MPRIVRLNLFTTFLALSFIFFIAMFGQQTYQEKWHNCVERCKKISMFGKLEPTHPQYGRKISNSLECRCY